MPALPKLRVPALERLAAQLRYEPPMAARRQLPNAERLATEIDPAQAYPEDFVVFRITGYRPEIDEPEMIVGEALLSDLSAFIERLCVSGQIGVDEITHGEAPAPPGFPDGRACHDWLTVEDLQQRWSVSRKTIERSRRRGLLARRGREDGGRERLLFAASAVERFEVRRAGSLESAGGFSRIPEALEQTMLRRARRYRARFRCSLNQAAARLATRYGRSHEAVRGVLQRHDDRARRPIFGARGPLTDRERRVVGRAMTRGVDASLVAARLGRSKASVYRVWSERRADRLRSLVERGLAGSGERGPGVGGVDEAVLSRPSVRTGLNTPTPGTFAIVGALPRTLSRRDLSAQRDQAQAKAALLARVRAGVARLPRFNPAPSDLDRIETDLRWVSRLERELVIGQLPTMVRTIEGRLERDLTSVPPRALEGLLAVCVRGVVAGVAAHEPSRGGALAARVGVEVDRGVVAWSRGEGARFVSREERGLAAVRTDPAHVRMPSWEGSLTPWQHALDPDARARSRVQEIDEPGRSILIARFGWDGSAPRTTEELSADLKMPPSHVTRRERAALHTLLAIVRTHDQDDA